MKQRRLFQSAVRSSWPIEQSLVDGRRSANRRRTLAFLCDGEVDLPFGQVAQMSRRPQCPEDFLLLSLPSIASLRIAVHDNKLGHRMAVTLCANRLACCRESRWLSSCSWHTFLLGRISTLIQRDSHVY